MILVPEPRDSLGHELVTIGGWADGSTSTYTYCVRCGMPPLGLPCRPTWRRRIGYSRPATLLVVAYARLRVALR